MGARNAAKILLENTTFVQAIEEMGYGDARNVAERAAERALKMCASPEHVAQVLELPMSKVLEIQENLSEPG